MSDAQRTGGQSGDGPSSPTIPPPEPPASPEAWYAPAVHAQYEILPGVVATVRETEAGFHYAVRDPSLDAAGQSALAAVTDHFGEVRVQPPLTRAGALERAAAWFPAKYDRVFDRLLSVSVATRRRVEYHTMCSLRLFGDLTPLALDDRIELADAAGTMAESSSADGRLVVHTADYAPVRTDYPADAPHVEHILAERLARYSVSFHGFDVPVVLRRDRLLGEDNFAVKYAVREPDLLPGDEALIEECKERIWETNVAEVVTDRKRFVTQRAHAFLSRQLTARNTRAWVAATRYRLRGALAEYDLAVPPVGGRYAGDRLDDLVYYVLRDYVGHGVLTIPIRDSHLEDIEANRVGERVKVVPRPDALAVTGGDGAGDDGTNAPRSPGALGRRVPTNLVFDDESEFVNVVTQLAAEDGTELSASTPSAKVNLSLDGGAEAEETIRCAVALPVVSEDGPHVSIRKQASDALTPADLLARGAISTDLVALLWLCYEHGRVVLFSGPTGVGKTTLMNAHMPFIPFDHRPISIDEGSREVRLPHETGVSLTTRDHENPYKRVTMADLMTETNYLNPDVEVIAEINTPESFRTFAETLNTGHGVVGTTHAEDVETLVNRVIEQGLPPYLLREIDLVVFPHRTGTDRYVSQAVELLSADEYDGLADHTTSGHGGAGIVDKDGREIHWNAVAWRDTDGDYHLDYDHPEFGDARRRLGIRLFDRLARVTDRPVEAVEAEFRRKHRYVQYIAREDISDFDGLFSFLADLRNDEAGTVARARTGPADGGGDSVRFGTRADGMGRSSTDETSGPGGGA